MGKKDAALHGMKKKDRRKLEERTAEIAAELARREAKSEKKSGKPKKGKKAERQAEATIIETVDHGAALGTMTIEAEAPIEAVEPEAEAPTHPHLLHLARVGKLAVIVADPDASAQEQADAEAELEGLRAETRQRNAERDTTAANDDAAIKARVASKRAAREAVKAVSADLSPDDVDRDDEAAVAAYNAHVASSGGGALLTSTAEKARTDAKLVGDGGSAETAATQNTAEAVAAIKSAVAEVETQYGRIFEVGAETPAPVVDSADEPVEFAKPSDAAPELEEGRNGYKIMALDASGKPDPRKVRQFTRVTTFVGNIDDETTLKKWDKRMVIEGLALDATSPTSEGLIPTIAELVHRREVAIAKAVKADRKGKLAIGEVAALVAAAGKVARDELDKIHERAAEIAGRNDKARAGTHLHALAELSDEKGVDVVRKMHDVGDTIHSDETGEDVPITATDLASIEAYAERMERLSAKVIESESVVVNDALGYAGRLDRVILAKLPELKINTVDGVVIRPADVRSRRYVTDIKSGRIDLGAGKIARQLAAYALGDLYDLETGERTKHGAARDIALVFHLPQGAGVCTVHAVDIKHGGVLLKLSAEVRKARNSGKKTIDTSVDIADPEPGGVVFTSDEGVI